MDLPSLATFGTRPREALMWPPRAIDVARIAAVLRVAGPRVVDAGAGTGLLAALLAREGIEVDAIDPAPPTARFHDVRMLTVADLTHDSDAAIVSWMEAGKDYRDGVAALAPVVLNVYDVEGGCGVMGAVDFPGFIEAASWRSPSFEDVAFAMERPGRGLLRKGHPGNRIDVLTRDPSQVGPLCDALIHATSSKTYPWEAEMDELGL